jgi:hypothetical protein
MTQMTLWGAHQVALSWFSREVEVPQEFYFALVHAETEPDPFMSGIELDEPLAEHGYARVRVDNTVDTWGSSLETVINNLTEIRFPVVTTEDWGPIGYWALCSSDVEGYVYLWGVFTTELFPEVGDEVVIDPETIQLEFSSVYQEVGDE